MKFTSLNQPIQDPVIIVRHWQMEYCKELGQAARIGAAMISYFDYWHTIIHQNKSKLDPGIFKWNPKKYQHHTDAEIARRIMIGGSTSVKKVKRWLIEKGVISTHSNPNPAYGFDKTTYYEFHPEVLNKWLEGYEPPAPKGQAAGDHSDRSQATDGRDADATIERPQATNGKTAGNRPIKSTTIEGEEENAQEQPATPEGAAGNKEKHSHGYQMRQIFEHWHRQVHGKDNDNYVPYYWQSKDYSLLKGIEKKLRAAMAKKNEKKPGDYSEEQVRTSWDYTLHKFAERGSEFKLTKYFTPAMISKHWNEIILELTTNLNARGRQHQSYFEGAGNTGEWGM